MSNKISSPQPLGPISVGNVVSAALRIYRDRFSVYYKQAFIANLWAIVPFYGWAKFFAISGLLSRLAYQEALASPETVSEARRNINPRLCTFLEAPILVGLTVALTMIIVAIPAGIIVSIINTFDSPVFNFISILLMGLWFISSYIWIFSRISLSEVPIAVENNNSATEVISRSWELTKSSVGRIMWIFSIAFLITLPITAIAIALNLFLQFNLPESIYPLVNLILSLTVNPLTLPIWQTIKGVTYYDLRSRKEGIDLESGES